MWRSAEGQAADLGIGQVTIPAGGPIQPGSPPFILEATMSKPFCIIRGHLLSHQHPRPKGRGPKQNPLLDYGNCIMLKQKLTSVTTQSTSEVSLHPAGICSHSPPSGRPCCTGATWSPKGLQTPTSPGSESSAVALPWALPKSPPEHGLLSPPILLSQPEAPFFFCQVAPTF